MTDQINLPRSAEGRPLYIEGYFADRLWRGEEPNYGYPTNHVPETTFSSMDIKTGFIVALKSKK